MTYTPDPAATYTTNYTLEKPSHGSHDGTWEQWIASAFDMIDAAIAAAAASGPGDVVGPASSTDNAIARFDSTTGKLLQDSGATLSDTGVLNLPAGGGVTVDGVALETGGSDYWEGSATAGEAIGNRCWIRYNAASGQWFSAHSDTVANCTGLIGRSTASYEIGATVTHVQIRGAITIDNSEAGNAIGPDWYLKSSQQPGLTPVKPAIARLVGHLIAGSYGASNTYTINIDPSPAPEVLPAIDALAAPTDITTLNATTAAHGLCPKGDGSTSNYLRGDLTWGTPAGSGGGTGVSRLAAIAPAAISILTSDAGAGKSGTIDLTATTGQIARIRLRSDFLAGQQPTPGTFQVNNASGISATATTIAYDSVSAGMVLATGGGDIVRIDGEEILTATGTTTTSIAVATRAYNGTVATYHDDNAVGFKCSDGLRLELYPNSNYLPTERLLTLRGLMTGKWIVGAAGVTNGSSFIPLTTSPAVLSDFGAGSLLAILDTVTDYARVQDIYGLVADSGTVNSIRTQTVRPAHAASTVVQRVLEYDLPVPFAFASGTSLYYKLFIDEKYAATVTVNLELIVDKYT